MPIIPALGRLRQKDFKFKTGLELSPSPKKKLTAT
jgi:hypothetical protein